MNKTMVYHSISTTSKSGQFDEACKKGEVIHSGHFMISSVADDQEETEDINHGRDSPIYHEQNRIIQLGYDFSTVSKETKNTYQFGPLPTNQITIDASLARLFQCMSLAYQGGKVVSPKWKNFKGMKLTVKDKIRLNNAIWRTWHIQYVMRKRKDLSLIQFATPMEIDYNSHARPEAVVMEGKYWKRRIETVVAEYKKWRAFFMNKLKLSDYPGLMWVSDNASTSPSKVATEFEKPRIADDVFINDFSDTLFSSLSQQPIQFPNPREIAMHATNSDMMQPGLLQLQPTVDEYMDFDSFHEWLNPPKKPTVSFSGASNQVFPPSDADIFGSGDLANILESSPIQQPIPPVKVSGAGNDQTGPSLSLQSMDLVTNFEMQPKSLEVQFVNQLTQPTEPTMFSSFNTSAPSYLPTRMQQQSPSIQQMPPTASSPNQVTLHSQYNQVQQPKMYPINTDHLLQQQQQHISVKPNQPRNGAYVSNQNIPTPVLNNRLQQSYPHSKLGTNSTSNRVVYSQPQIEYFSQNQVVMQQNATSVTVPVHHIQPQQQHALHGGDGVTMNQTAVNPMNNNQMVNCQNKAVGELQQQQTAVQLQQQTGNAVNIGATTNNVILLKQLITSSNTSIAPPRRMKKNQEIRSKPVQQMPALGSPMQKSSQPMIDIMSGVPQGSKSGPTMAIVEKRRSVEGNHPVLRSPPQEPWPQTRFSEISSPVKSSSVQDVHMEQVSFDPLSPASQDAEISQLAVMQRQGSFSTTEQKRRFNIKIGFTRMLKLLPGGNSQSNAKASKATLMGKATQYITTMQAERRKMAEEIRKLKEDMENLQLSINSSQQQLPASGAPVTRKRTEEAKIQFRAWARQRTRQDWKFYLFGVMIRPWFDSYQKEVSIRSLAEFHQSVFEWLETYCSLPALRPSVVQSLQILSTTTNILSNPSQLRQQIEEAVSDRHQPSQSARPPSSKNTS